MRTVARACVARACVGESMCGESICGESMCGESMWDGRREHFFAREDMITLSLPYTQHMERAQHRERGKSNIGRAYSQPSDGEHTFNRKSIQSTQPTGRAHNQPNEPNHVESQHCATTHSAYLGHSPSLLTLSLSLSHTHTAYGENTRPANVENTTHTVSLKEL